jgi:hypothetical protein
MAGKVDSNTHAAAIAKIGQVAKHEVALRAHLEEIINGAAFKGSHRSQAFLKHIVEQSLHGEPADLRERSIGVALFGRPATYDTADDAIVRVTASDVRKRLLQHYGGSGNGSHMRISLPSGSYVPEFCLDPEPVRNGDSPAALKEPEALRLPAVETSRRPIRAWQVAVAALVLGAAAIVWWALARGSARQAGSDLILASFPDAALPVQVVVADDALVLIQVLLDRRFTLNEYENQAYLNPPELIQKKELQRFWGSLSTRQITNVGDLQNANRITGMLQSKGREASVRQARQMHARSFRSGNFVILGSSFSNPWADLFAVNESSFPFEGLPRPGMPEVILNRQPRDVEPSRFEAYADPKTGRKTTFARVSLVENTGHSGRVLVVAGQSMSATEMAGEMLLRAGSAARVRRMLGLAANAPLPALEMVLRVSEQNEVGDNVEIVACRKIAVQKD